VESLARPGGAGKGASAEIPHAQRHRGTGDPPALATALWALDEGLWPVPITAIDDKTAKSPGKQPIGRAWGKERHDAEWLRATYKRHSKAGVGLKLGAEGRVIDIDVDQPEHARVVLERIFPNGLPGTMGWSNAGGKFHLLFQWDDRLIKYAKAIIKGAVRDDGEIAGNPHYAGLEIRIGAASGDGRQLQSVIPPSLMSNGQARRWNDNTVILPLPDSFFADLDAHALPSHSAPPDLLSGAIVEGQPASAEVPKALDVTSVPRRPGKSAPQRPDAETRAVKYLAACPPAISGSNGHDQLFKACKVGPGFDLDPETAFRLLHDYYNPRCEPPWSEQELRHKVNDAYSDPKNSPRGWLLNEPPRNGHQRSSRNGMPTAPPTEIPPAPTRADAGDGRPEILITTEEHEVIDQAVKALTSEPNVFQRGNALVTVLRDPVRTKRPRINRPKGSPRIAPLPLPRLREMMTKTAAWKRPKIDRNGDLDVISAHPPDWAIHGVSARGEWDGIRPLDAIIETPSLRPDGTILDSPGWDEETELLYEPNIVFPKVPLKPTREDARYAAERLMELVVDFPFAGENHGAAWLAGLLTPFARFAVDGPCPLFFFDANTPGSGKSKLTDIIAVISNGREMPRTAYPDGDEEMRKRITSTALAGDRLMLIDNITTLFGGGSLDSMLTARTWKDRRLGSLENTPDLPLYTVWYATGNNVGWQGDMLRRLVYCRLESPEEHPEERADFVIKGDLVEHVRRVRPQLVAAVLTILRAHYLAGQPEEGLKPFGSFEAWSKTVRSAVHWATGFDPCATRKEVQEADSESNARAALIEAWSQLPYSDRGVTVADALRALKDRPELYTALHDCLIEMSRNGELPSPKVIGHRLKKLRGCVINGKKFLAVTDRNKKIQMWKVVEG
jgi:hypothetical protein